MALHHFAIGSGPVSAGRASHVDGDAHSDAQSIGLEAGTEEPEQDFMDTAMFAGHAPGPTSADLRRTS